MADLIFRDELPLADISENDVGEAFIAYFRNHREEIPQEVKVAIVKEAFIKDQRDRLLERVDASERRARFGEWVSLFLETRKSDETRKRYEFAIERLKAFCAREGIEPSELSYEHARRFTTSSELAENMRGGRRSENSIRTDIAAVSSLYSEIDRLSEGKIRNPFLRIDTKPGKQRTGGKAVPQAAELDAILANTSGEVRAAVACMAFRGFRIGALPELTLATRDGKTTFRTVTKGKAQAGVMPGEAMDAIEQAGLSRKKPFGIFNEKQLTKRIERELDRLACKGLIAGRAVERKIKGKARTVVVSDYSCHSFRHFYAVAQYNATKDAEKVRKLLNHADLNTTQVYLQSLGCMEE